MTPLIGLFLVFLHLQLSGSIDWSWFLVLLPLLFKVVIWILVAAAKDDE